MGVPGWLEVGLGELSQGVAEIPGPASNPSIVKYLKGVGLASEDETPWCSAFVNYCLGCAGVAGTGRPNARSYLTWGVPSDERLGAIVVLSRGDPNGWTGHVGFILDSTPGSLYLLGGNQSDRVSLASFPRERLLGVRWPAT